MTVIDASSSSAFRQGLRWLTEVVADEPASAGFDRWFGPLMSGVRRDGLPGSKRLGVAWIRDLVSPYVKLAQFMYEALPREVPDLCDGSTSTEFVPMIARMSSFLGHDYDHIGLYQARRADFDYRHNVICQSVSPRALALGPIDQSIRSDVVCRVPAPLFIPQNLDMVGDGAVVRVLKSSPRPSVVGGAVSGGNSPIGGDPRGGR